IRPTLSKVLERRTAVACAPLLRGSQCRAGIACFSLPLARRTPLRLFSTQPVGNGPSSPASTSIADLSKTLSAINSPDSLRQNLDAIFQTPASLPTTVVVQLLKKAGDYQANDLLPVIYNRYYEIFGYADVVTAEVIDQYCRSYNLAAIRSLYFFLTKNRCPISGVVCEKFFLSLLRSMENERVCLTIAKEMLIQGHHLSLKAVHQALSLPAACDSEMIITILRLANPKELPAPKMLPILSKRIVSLSQAKRHVSVYDLYNYIVLIAPTRNHSQFLPYITKSFEYFVERNLSITYDSSDSTTMRALTRALLTKRFNKPEDLSPFVAFIAKSPILSGIVMDELFLHFAAIGCKNVDSSTWSQLIACNIPIEQSKVQPIVKTLKQNGHADIIRGFLRYMEANSPLALSKDTVHELEQICKENENRPISVPFLEHVASGAWDGLTAAETTAFARELPSLSTEEREKAVVSLYGAALHSRDERVRELLRAGVSSLEVEAVKAVVERCVKKEKVYSTLEAKQFVLALVRSKRVEDANAVAQLLHDKLN
ncbi:hypothetical protein WA577_006531, partial [Blastocystis sp. JDR]